MTMNYYYDGMNKAAAVFGAMMPDGLERGEVPYEQRRGMCENYLNAKSQEKPTSSLRAGLTGGLAGSIPLMLLSALGGGSTAQTLSSGALGGIGGALVGRAMAAADRREIDAAKAILNSGAVDQHLADHIIDTLSDRNTGRWMDDERRRQELMGAMQGRQGY